MTQQFIDIIIIIIIIGFNKKLSYAT